jgi:hypothetical protein
MTWSFVPCVRWFCSPVPAVLRTSRRREIRGWQRPQRLAGRDGGGDLLILPRRLSMSSSGKSRALPLATALLPQASKVLSTVCLSRRPVLLVAGAVGSAGARSTSVRPTCSLVEIPLVLRPVVYLEPVGHFEQVLSKAFDGFLEGSPSGWRQPRRAFHSDLHLVGADPVRTRSPALRARRCRLRSVADDLEAGSPRVPVESGVEAVTRDAQ